MERVYAILVKAGRKTRDDVPDEFVEATGKILLKQGFISNAEFERNWKPASAQE